MSDRSSHAPAESRLASPAIPGLDLAVELRSALDRAGELARTLELNLREASERGDSSGSSSEERAVELERRLATAESDVKELASRLVDSEHQGGRLMNLYVATYQLHATLDPAEVQATIAEIAINLLGAERFVLLLRRDEANQLFLPGSAHQEPRDVRRLSSLWLLTPQSGHGNQWDGRRV